MAGGSLRWKGRRGVLGGGLFLCAWALLRYPQEAGEAVREGLALCGQVLLPALFPFLILTGLVVSLGLAGDLGQLLEGCMGPLFHLSGPCSAALVLGAIGGYPVGARTIRSLWEQGLCSQEEGERMLGFCCNAAPGFLLGVVGAGIFGSRSVGIFLWGIHLAAGVLTGLLLRPRQRPAGRQGGVVSEGASFSAAFVDSVQGAVSSAMGVCGFVVCFSVLLRLCRCTGLLSTGAGVVSWLLAPLGMSREGAVQLLTGLLELSSGVATLRDGGICRESVALCAFFLGWAGLSVQGQLRSLVEGSGLRGSYLLPGRLCQGLFSAGLAWLLFPLLPEEILSTSGSGQAPLATAVPTAGQLLALSAIVALCLFILLCLLAPTRWEKERKPGGRRGKKRV